MPYLSHLNFDTVHEALKSAIKELDATYETGKLLETALELMYAANAEIASPGLRERAHEMYGSDEVEIDDEGVGTSPADGGTWVQAWVWVPAADIMEDEPDAT